jgi:hypothetical protein
METMSKAIRVSSMSLVVATFFICFANSVLADEQAPQWLREASAQAVAGYDRDVPGVVLHDEQQVTLGADGKLITVENRAVRLLIAKDAI